MSQGDTAARDIAAQVKRVVIEHLSVDESKVVDSANFINDLDADSLDTVELVMAFEEEFGCEIPDAAAEKIVTVKDAIDFISNSLNSEAASGSGATSRAGKESSEKESSGKETSGQDGAGLAGVAIGAAAISQLSSAAVDTAGEEPMDLDPSDMDSAD